MTLDAWPSDTRVEASHLRDIDESKAQKVAALLDLQHARNKYSKRLSRCVHVQLSGIGVCVCVHVFMFVFVRW
jgi:hypothetical protein